MHTSPEKSLGVNMRTIIFAWHSGKLMFLSYNHSFQQNKCCLSFLHHTLNFHLPCGCCGNQTSLECILKYPKLANSASSFIQMRFSRLRLGSLTYDYSLIKVNVKRELDLPTQTRPSICGNKQF